MSKFSVHTKVTKLGRAHIVYYDLSELTEITDYEL